MVQAMGIAYPRVNPLSAFDSLWKDAQMNGMSPLPTLPPDVSEYSVRIAWHGPQDKPFYNALLVSPSRAALIMNEPFWNYAVIGTAEFRRLVDALAFRPGYPLMPGPYQPDGPEYYVEIKADGQMYHSSLGFDQAAGTVLRQVAAALEPDHRQPIQTILVRIGQT